MQQLRIDKRKQHTEEESQKADKKTDKPGTIAMILRTVIIIIRSTIYSKHPSFISQFNELSQKYVGSGSKESV